MAHRLRARNKMANCCVAIATHFAATTTGGRLARSSSAPCISSILLGALLFLSACTPFEKRDQRTPLMPYFADVTKDEYSKTNPYFTSFTQFYDRQEIKLSDGTVYRTQSPTLVSPIGTYYEYPERLYYYAMTGGIGFQYDFWKWDTGKVSFGGLAGLYQNWGALLAISQKLPWAFPMTPYLTLQRRTSYSIVSCEPGQYSRCLEESRTGRNDVRIREDVFNPVFGLLLGRFLLKQNTQATMYAKTEFGWNEILDKEIEREDFPSDLTHTNGPLLTIELGFTLW